jgi:uncharacterized membrane protein/pimeloyl-ACP methyl ester carboxylesterase
MNRRIVIVTGLLSLLSLAAGIAFYDKLPDPVPTHFDVAGNPNGYTSKPIGAFILPLILAGLGLVLSVLPKISPRGYAMESFRRVFEIISISILGIVFIIGVAALLQALGWRPPIDRIVLPAIGALFIILGNFMGKLRRNFFVGIRTPWTLASEEVWLRTHRLGGPLFVAAGVILMFGAFLGGGPALIVPVVVIAAIIPVVYSYVIYRRLDRGETDSNGTAVVLLIVAMTTLGLTAPSLFAQQTDLTIAAGAIHGTLLMPQVKAPLPVVLIIAGSGPTDRDGNTPALPGKNNSLKMLATDFAANGIASLRYDKRGIAQSGEAATKESDLRFETYIDDAVEWCNRLRQDERFSGVIIAGHSEGSLIGMVAAKRCKATGFISLEGAGFPAADIIRTQLKGRLPESLAGPSETILKSLEAGKTVADTPPQLAMLYRASVQPYLISWFKYDPAKEIAALTIPTLIVQGTTDVQVSVDDAKRLAAANPRAKLVIIDGMNHLMKNASGDIQKQLPSYGDPTLQLNEKLTPALVEFVRGATKK